LAKIEVARTLLKSNSTATSTSASIDNRIFLNPSNIRYTVNRKKSSHIDSNYPSKWYANSLAIDAQIDDLKNIPSFSPV